MLHLPNQNVTAKEQSEDEDAQAFVVTNDEPCRTKELHAALHAKQAYEQFVDLLTYTSRTKAMREALDYTNDHHRSLLELVGVVETLRLPLLAHSQQAVADWHTQYGLAEAAFQRRVAMFAAHHGPEAF